MLNYAILVKSLNDYFEERYHDVSISTDIFEHAFLRFFGYHLVPERCQFSPINKEKEHNSFYIDLWTPYGVSVSEFVQDLQNCASRNFSQVLVDEIKSSSEKEFCVRLTIPYQLIKDNVMKLSLHVDSILLKPAKKEAYRYWTHYLAPYGLSLSIAHIEMLISDIQQNFPSNSLAEIWSAVVKKASDRPKDSSLKVLNQNITADKERYPEIIFTCQIGGDKTTLILTRDKVVSALKDSVSLYQFLTHDTASEFLVPVGIHSFINEKYYRNFSLNAEGRYEIDFGYHYREIKILEKLGIKAIKSYRPMGSVAEKSRYYVYDKQNYLKALIALKEIKGEPCLDERLHQLKYSIRTENWDKLSKQLDFFLDFSARTGLKIDYLQLGLRLFDFAKGKPEKEVGLKIIEIVAYAFNQLIAHKRAVTEPKKLHAVLFEINLMRMNRLMAKDGDETEKYILIEELFRHAQQADLAESNRLLAELCGFRLGQGLIANVNQDPLAVIVELAAGLKKLNEKLASSPQKTDLNKPVAFFIELPKEPSSSPSVAATSAISVAKK
ncbi:MAG: hypothetical protein CFE62_002165 [Candidatus Aquirickettsiella gammari]|uniref:Uncharacterized protein n=1 Tax=Candidatus Aquirickettsiella gammari TaxID=2016198 RepID=A0A370CIY7_9COXI|nr:MAG: hypothetical protein CFE62_002165 [Candidatus Aquirickettsiella gammari]